MRLQHQNGFKISTKNNLRRILLSLMAVAAFTLTSSVAKADTFTLVNGGPSMTAIYTASGFAGSTASATFSLNGNVLTVALTNTSTDVNTALTALGLNTTPNCTVQSFAGTGAASGWTLNQGALGVFEVSAAGQGRGMLFILPTGRRRSPSPCRTFQATSRSTQPPSIYKAYPTEIAINQWAA